MPVSIMPGCTELTRMPLGPSSIAAALVMPRMANLVAEYAVHIAMPPRPSIEEAFTIEPPPFLRMVRATDFMPRKQPSWLTLTSSMYSSTSIRSTSAKRRMPALLTSTLTGPKRSLASSTSACQEASSLTS